MVLKVRPNHRTIGFSCELVKTLHYGLFIKIYAMDDCISTVLNLILHFRIQLFFWEFKTKHRALAYFALDLNGGFVPFYDMFDYGKS